MLYRDPDWPSATILIVDDIPAIRKMVRAMLTQNGYNCLEAGDGAEALHLLDSAGDVQLVLTDVIMPNMDGAELARQVTQTRPELPVLFMSGFADDSAVRTLGRSFAFLEKPFTATALIEKVRQTLDGTCVGVPDSRASLNSA